MYPVKSCPVCDVTFQFEYFELSERIRRLWNLFREIISIIGKPIVCNVNIAYDDIITDNQLGIAGGLNTPRKYADAILKIYHLDKENYDRMCGRVREVAKRFDFEVLSKQLKKVLEQE